MHHRSTNWAFKKATSTLTPIKKAQLIAHKSILSCSTCLWRNQGLLGTISASGGLGVNLVLEIGRGFEFLCRLMSNYVEKTGSRLVADCLQTPGVNCYVRRGKMMG
jgi:hypothetical protein